MDQYYGFECPNGHKIAMGIVSDEGSKSMAVTAIPELDKPIMCLECGDSGDYTPDDIVEFDVPDCYVSGCPRL
jgi:hypothetical protein